MIHRLSKNLYLRDAKQMIVELYSDIIPKYLGEDVEIQVLSPLKRRGNLATKEINRALQEKVNPFDENKPELKIGDFTVRVNDRVIQTVNNYELNVYNGDIGVVQSINRSELTCVVVFGVGEARRTVIYKKDQLYDLELSYAITSHKSQGSEFDCIVVPIVSQHYMMLYKSLVYTTLTRAKKMAIFIGERKALAMAVNNIKPNERQTMLMHLLKVKNSVLSI